MRYLFIFQIGQKEKYCCCFLKSGLITMAVLAIIFASISFTMGRGLFSLIINGLGCILPILVLIPVCTYKPTLVKVATIIYTIYLYLVTILVITVTVYLAGHFLDTELIILIVDMWLYLLFLFFACYAFTSFTCNYEQVMGVATGGHTIPLNIARRSSRHTIEGNSSIQNEYELEKNKEDIEKPQKSVPKN
jgi:hypothetical protein